MIHYYSEQVRFVLKDKRKISSWISFVASSYGFKIKEINYVFSDDEYVLDINKRFLNHDYYTDIITFDTSDYDLSNDDDHALSADIFISLDTVRSNSTTFGVEFMNELHRVMIHGILHLIGFDDLTDDDFKSMKERENSALSILYEK